tara:strand:- start:5704 stop:8415 length:2712 start_codon:yes stop_codon:yes gene_type:complete
MVRKRRSIPNTLEKLNDRSGEVIGLSFMFVSVFIAVSLLSFDSRDPHPFNVVSPSLGIQNYCGFLGSYISGLMIFFFGALSCLIPILMLLCGVSLFSGKRLWLPRYKDFLYLLILLSACSLFFKTFENDVIFGKGVVSGGIIGESLSTFLNMYLGTAGSWIALLAVFTISVSVVSNLSFQSYGTRVGSIFSFLGKISLTPKVPRKFIEFFSRFRKVEKDSSFESEKVESDSSYFTFFSYLKKLVVKVSSSIRRSDIFSRKESHIVANLNSPVLDEANLSDGNFIPGPAFHEEKKVQPVIEKTQFKKERSKDLGKLLEENSSSIEGLDNSNIDLIREQVNSEEEKADYENHEKIIGDYNPSVLNEGVPVNTEVDSSSVVRLEDESFVEQGSSETPTEIPKRIPKKSLKYELPSLDFFTDPPSGGVIVNESLIREKSQSLENALLEFGVEGKVTEVKTGPVITVYEFSPAPGVKVSKIVSLSDDLARALSAYSVRIVAPIPGKSVVGIEVPNEQRNAVYAKEVLASKEFNDSEQKLTIGLGSDILGRTALTDLAKIPHLLIAGTTGSGKSVSLNMMICSLLSRCMPREVRFLMIDPKLLELSIYEGIPHLLVPVVTDAEKAASALRGIIVEMEKRYQKMNKLGVRNIDSYNEFVAEGLTKKQVQERLQRPLEDDSTEAEGETLDFLPYIVVVIDELADLMMVSSRDVEEAMTRLAQMARAAGIHLLVATQRPSVDVLTGLIKANFPSRIALRVATRTDSRTILDSNGAERLLGKGDMLFVPPGTSVPVRIHGSYVSEKEIHSLVGHWKNQGPAVFREDIFVEKETRKDEVGDDENDYDERYDEAVALISRTKEVSISLIQRHMRIGYNRAARMIEQMERDKIVGPADGIKRRPVLIDEIPETDHE